jgi:hypothetical protein
MDCAIGRALRRDIELSMAAGYNGARLHQKVFEPRTYIGLTNWLYCLGRVSELGFDYRPEIMQII